MVDVEKTGEVYVVYVTSAAKKTIASIPGYGAKVPGFPQTYTSLSALQAFLPGEEFNFIEAPKPKKLPMPSNHNQGTIAASVRLKQAPGTSEALALIYFTRLIDRYKWCAAESKDTVLIQVELAGDFIISLWPALAEELEGIKASTLDGKFKL